MRPLNDMVSLATSTGAVEGDGAALLAVWVAIIGAEEDGCEETAG